MTLGALERIYLTARRLQEKGDLEAAGGVDYLLAIALVTQMAQRLHPNGYITPETYDMAWGKIQEVFGVQQPHREVVMH